MQKKKKKKNGKTRENFQPLHEALPPLLISRSILASQFIDETPGLLNNWCSTV